MQQLLKLTIASALVLLLMSVGATPFANPITDENSLSGTGDWRILWKHYAANREIEGYAGLASAPRGTRIDLHISTAGKFTFDLYRMGYYQGLGGRHVFGPLQLRSTAQRIPRMDAATGLIECNWPTTYTLSLQPGWISGVYLVKLTQLSTGRQAYIIFSIRENTRPSAVLFDSSVTTYEAYNSWGGKSLYCYSSDSRPVGAVSQGICNGGVAAVKVSFDRPHDRGQGAGDFFRWEFPLLAYLESQGYDLTYTTSVNLQAAKLFDANGNPLHRAYLSTGHDEYWSLNMRNNVELMRDSGVGIGFFGGNVMGWEVRLDPDSAGNANRTLVSYKFDWANDPLNQLGTECLVTAGWDDTRNGVTPTPIGELTGVDCNEDPVTGDIVISDASSWVFTGTGLQNGDHLTGLNGFESGRVCNGSAPAGTTILADSPNTNGQTPDSNMVIYQASSGAWVFATGTMSWSWGLSDLTNMPPHGLVDRRVQMTTNNIMTALIRGH